MNWGSAVTDSALWLAEAYAITVVVLVVTALLLARYTVWGNQFRRMAWPYFDPRRTVIPLSILALLLLLTIFGVRVTVLFSYWYKDFYDAIQNLDETAFWHYLRVFAILAAVHVASSLVVYLVGQTLDINWRSWLNDTLTDDWLDGRATIAETSWRTRSTIRTNVFRQTSPHSRRRPARCPWAPSPQWSRSSASPRSCGICPVP